MNPYEVTTKKLPRKGDERIAAHVFNAVIVLAGVFLVVITNSISLETLTRSTSTTWRFWHDAEHIGLGLLAFGLLFVFLDITAIRDRTRLDGSDTNDLASSIRCRAE